MNTKRLAISLIAPQLAGFLGSIATTPAIPTWYADLAKPGFSPPSWIFGPVWLTLYLLMGIAVYLAWEKAKKKSEKQAVNIFWVHLLFNFSWSLVFFGYQNPELALINILVLWVMIVVLILRFWKFSKISSYLLIPYLLWVSFASILNYSIAALN